MGWDTCCWCKRQWHDGSSSSATARAKCCSPKCEVEQRQHRAQVNAAEVADRRQRETNNREYRQQLVREKERKVREKARKKEQKKREKKQKHEEHMERNRIEREREWKSIKKAGKVGAGVAVGAAIIGVIAAKKAKKAIDDNKKNGGGGCGCLVLFAIGVPSLTAFYEVISNLI